MKRTINDDPARGPKVEIEEDGPDMFVIVDGVTIARRGHPGTTEADTWVAVTAPFAVRITGHQQVTDAYLLGMAIKENGVLVTFDRRLKYLAGAEFARNLMVIE